MSDAVMVPRESIEALAREYRPSMDKDTVHDWGADAASMLKRLAASTPVGGWEDISTAPKDGTRMCVAFDDCPDLPYHWEIGRFSHSKGWVNTYGHPFSGEPTHWFVPAAPTPPSVSIDNGSRPQEAVPTEQADAAVLVLKRMLGEVESFHRAPDNARIWIGGWSTYSGQRDPSLVHVGEVRAAIGDADGCSSNEGAGQ